MGRNQFASPGKPEIPHWQRTSAERTQLAGTTSSNDTQENVIKDAVEESSN